MYVPIRGIVLLLLGTGVCRVCSLVGLQVASDALEVGSSVLLPPVVDRLELLLSLLPEHPSLITTLTTGQVCGT